MCEYSLFDRSSRGGDGANELADVWMAGWYSVDVKTQKFRTGSHEPCERQRDISSLQRIMMEFGALLVDWRSLAEC